MMADWSERQLVEAIENNRYDAFASFGRSPHGSVQDDAKMLRVYTSIPVLSPLCGWIFRARLAPDDLKREIDRAVSGFAARKLPVIWNTGPSTRPPDLATHLLEHGFAEVFDLAGMAAHLDTLNEPQAVLPQLRIEAVHGEDDALRQWADAFVSSFGVAGPIEESVYQLFASLFQQHDIPWQLYLAVLDGRPVATSAMYAHAGVAGIYFVGTIPEARRRGIGALVTLAPLQQAADMGYEIAVLHASPMAVNVYRTLGFQEYCRMGLFAWQPDT